jgi:hypothetical protein
VLFLRCYDNMTSFQRACATLGVPESERAPWTDFKDEKERPVFRNLAALKAVADRERTKREQEQKQAERAAAAAAAAAAKQAALEKEKEKERLEKEKRDGDSAMNAVPALDTARSSSGSPSSAPTPRATPGKASLLDSTLAAYQSTLASLSSEVDSKRAEIGLMRDMAMVQQQRNGATANGSAVPGLVVRDRSAREAYLEAKCDEYEAKLSQYLAATEQFQKNMQETAKRRGQRGRSPLAMTPPNTDFLLPPLHLPLTPNCTNRGEAPRQRHTTGSALAAGQTCERTEGPRSRFEWRSALVFGRYATADAGHGTGRRRPYGSV